MLSFASSLFLAFESHILSQRAGIVCRRTVRVDFRAIVSLGSKHQDDGPIRYGISCSLHEFLQASVAWSFLLALGLQHNNRQKERNLPQFLVNKTRRVHFLLLAIETELREQPESSLDDEEIRAELQSIAGELSHLLLRTGLNSCLSLVCLFVLHVHVSPHRYQE